MIKEGVREEVEVKVIRLMIIEREEEEMEVDNKYIYKYFNNYDII